MLEYTNTLKVLHVLEPYVLAHFCITIYYLLPSVFKVNKYINSPTNNFVMV